MSASWHPEGLVSKEQVFSSGQRLDCFQVTRLGYNKGTGFFAESAGQKCPFPLPGKNPSTPSGRWRWEHVSCQLMVSDVPAERHRG